ncbi:MULTISPECIES: histidine kinase [unclassified Streptomyces]|uniref:sensor histidine kinase n=1 Tax=unclassified Streptomyces TaxID=2593676 RepID=UPI0013A6AD66|nr:MULTISPECIES: histidine kinase [unclassified Streptomyces]
MQAVPGRAGQLLERGLRTLTGESGGAPDPVRARRTDICLALLCGLLTTLNLHDVHRFGLVSDYPTSLAAGWLAAASLLWRRSRPWLPALVATAATVVSDDRGPLVFAAYALAAYGRAHRWGGVLLMAVAYAATRDLFLPLGYAGRDPASFVLGSVLVPALYGETVRRNRRVMAALRERARQAHAAVDQAADLAVVQERTRLAQRTHDGLGHRLTALTMQAAALRLDAGADPRVREGAAAVEESARAAMAEVREVLDMLTDPAGSRSHTSPVDVGRFLGSLARNMRATGMEITHHTQPGLGAFPAADGRLLLRIAREGLTNAAKYAPGSAVRMNLYTGDGEVRLDVVNTAPEGERIVLDSGGMGIPGLRAALAEVGGRLRSGPGRDGGHMLAATLPDRRVLA